MTPSTTGSNLRKAREKLTSTFIAIIAITFVLLGFPGLTAPANAGPGGTETLGWVTRLNVTDAFEAVEWYMDKLDMEIDPSTEALPYYAQVFYPEYPDTQIGLSASSPVQSGKATPTIIVSDIIPARESLLNKGVEVTPLCNAGDGYTALAFFCDLDGNNLALRENNFPNDFEFCSSPICNNCD